MSDVLLFLLASLYIVFFLVDVYVTARLWGPTRREPRIDAMVASTNVILCVTIGGFLGALLGLNGIWRQITGTVFLPPEITLVALVFALGIPSAGVLNYLRQLRKWDGHDSVKVLRAHRRATDHAVHLHRRSTDTKPTDDVIIMSPQDPATERTDPGHDNRVG